MTLNCLTKPWSYLMSNQKRSLYIEVEPSLFWKITKIAAEKEMYPEDWIENNLETLLEILVDIHEKTLDHEV